MLVAFGVGAVGNLLGSAIAGVDTGLGHVGRPPSPQIVLGNVLGMAIGFTLGVLLRSLGGRDRRLLRGLRLVLPGILELLALVREWFSDLQPWIDWNDTQVALFEGATTTGEDWAMFASTTAIWIVVPLALGLTALRRSEIK